MVKGKLENPFDLNTKPFEEWDDLMGVFGGGTLPTGGIAGHGGDVLKVKDDETGLEWGAGGGGGGTTNYNSLNNKPQINGVTLQSNKTSDELGLVKKNWGTSEAGKFLKIGSDGNVTSETGGSGTTDYTALTNKPKINNVELTGNKSLNDIDVYSKSEVSGLVDVKQDTLVSGTNIKTIEGNSVLGSGNIVLPVKPHHATHELGGTDEVAIHATQVTAGQLAVARIPDLNASKITDGVFDIGRIPPTALNNLVKVADDAARFALTPTDVAKGDSVYVNSTKKLYLVVDTTKLSAEDGYLEYDADVDWVSITGKPATFPSTFGQITGNVSDNSSLTTALNAKVNKSWGTAEAGKALIIGSDGNVIAGSAGVGDYTGLSNKPQINGVELSGNKTADDLGLVKDNWGTTSSGKYLMVGASGLVIADAGSTATVAFNQITGDPYDNANLDTALGEKVDVDWDTSYNGKVLGIVSGVVTPVSPAGDVKWKDITGEISESTTLTTALNKRVPYANDTDNFKLGVETVGGIQKLYLEI